MSQLVFGKYEVLRRLAIGGMGEVFLARQSGIPGFERLAILKNLLPELASREGFVDQFLDEARVAATLNHPNLVQIFEVGLWNGTYFIAMEYIPGENLAGIARAAQAAGTPLPLPVVAKVIHDAALGLAHAHDALDVRGVRLNIVHRDVSPQNIMVRGDGVTKVVDFGIAKASNRQTRTQTGALKGKLGYMPAEQALGKELDGRADQYSLGVVLWELSTGKRLFRGENEVEILKKVLSQRIPRPSELVPGFPPELEAVVMRMVDKKPEARYPALGEAAAGLRAYLESCSREASEHEVAAVVSRLVGAVLDERSKAGATPSDNFVISFDRPGSSPGSRPGDGPRVTTRPGLRDRDSGDVTQASRPGEAGAPAARGAAVRPGQEEQQDRLATTKSLPAASAPAPGTRRGWLLPLALAAGGVVTLLVVALGFQLLGPAGVEPALVTVQPPVAAPPAGAAAPPAQLPAEERRLPGPPPAPPTLVIRSEPPGATVKRGAEVLGTTPATIRTLAAGIDQTLTIELAGHRAEELPVRLEAGATREVLLALTRLQGRTTPRPPQPAPPPPVPVASKGTKGSLSLVTTPWTQVIVDGEPSGSTPVIRMSLAAGSHKLRLVNEEAGVDVVRKIEIRPDETLKLTLDLSKK